MSVNYGVKHFRHALAIDERRSIFRPNLWSELTVEREQELDVDLPAPRDDPSTQRDGWKYHAPRRDHADIKEVWFTGDLTRANTSVLAYNYQVAIQTLVPILRGALTVYHPYRCVG